LVMALKVVHTAWHIRQRHIETALLCKEVDCVGTM
jgi:hypothetical protein